jgi:hypothetical protein
VTVSPTGGGTPPNNGADFGPDTLLHNVGPGKTVTNGIMEAIMSTSGLENETYCLGGSYSIAASLYNNHSGQVVRFSAGAILTFSPTGAYETIDLDGPCDILVGTQRTPNEQNYHDCYWLGNGAQIIGSGLSGSTPEQVFGAQHVAASVYAVGYKLVVEGFTISNIGNISFLIGADNYATGVTYTQQVRQVRFSRISATWYAGLDYTAGASGFLVSGSARQVLIEDCLLNANGIDGSPLPDLSNCFIRANAGDTTQVVVRRSLFIQPAASGSCTDNRGSCWELQGNDSAMPGNIGPNNCHGISIEGCVFDSGRSSAAAGGCGGGYIDDYDSNGSEEGYITNVVFRRTHLVSVFSGYRAHSTGTLGELSFKDGSPLGAWFPQQVPPPYVGNTLPYRIPGDGGASLNPLPSTGPYSYKNLNGFKVTFVVNSGGVTTITINGSNVGLLTGAFQLAHGDTLELVYGASNPPNAYVLSIT